MVCEIYTTGKHGTHRLHNDTQCRLITKYATGSSLQYVCFHVFPYFSFFGGQGGRFFFFIIEFVLYMWPIWSYTCTMLYICTNLCLQYKEKKFCVCACCFCALNVCLMYLLFAVIHLCSRYVISIFSLLKINWDWDFRL